MSLHWPAALPQCPLRPMSRTPLPNVISFGTEVGPGKLRRRSAARVKSHALAFLLTGAQRAVFETFFESDLCDGALSFRWLDPVAGTTGTWRFSPDAPYSLDQQGPDAWLLSAKLDRVG